MIPVSSKEYVEYKDSDGTNWRFKPKSGSLEKEMYLLWEDGISQEESAKRLDAFMDKIILSPIDEYKKADYNSLEKSKIINFWNNANRLTIEEKKS
jgi:hypothetical protein